MTAPRLDPFYRLLAYDTLDSTSDEAKRLAIGGAGEGTLVWARQQSAGRGRRERSWSSPPGNLYASWVLHPRCSVGIAAQLGFVAAVAVGEACAPLLPNPADLGYKWPNDVLIGGSKMAGILLESQTAGDGALAWLVLGIGVNIASHPAATEYPATSLAAAGAGDVAPAAPLEAVAAHFLAWYRRWHRGEGFAEVRAAWLARAHRLGSKIRVRLPREEISGRFAGLDEDGRLLLDSAAGRQRIAAAEIFPAG